MERNTEEIAAMFRKAGASPDKNNVHVLISNGHWKLVKEGNNRATAIFNSKEEAISEAKKYGKSGNAKAVIIHTVDGEVEKRLQY
ncbi:MAG: DUF2188 domain-containing protein [Chitinophagaceae bacterium]